MFNPLLNKISLRAILSSRVTPSTGAGISADPPPETRKSTWSFLSVFFNAVITCLDASAPASLGTGCPVLNISQSSTFSLFSWWVMQIQLFGPFMWGRRPLIIAGAAFPTPITKVLPPDLGSGRPYFLMQDCTAVKGFALSTAAS